MNMLSNLYKLQTALQKTPLKSRSKRLITVLINAAYPTYIRLQRCKAGKVHELDKQLIVSLTTFTARIDTVNICIESILRQTVKADKVLLWLSKDEFCDMSVLPKQLVGLCDKGLEIRFCDDNLMPHKKSYYTAKEFQDSYILTVDDDVYYPENTIESLELGCKTHNNCVICNTARRISLDSNGNIISYEGWTRLRTGSHGPSHMLLAIGSGGTLYPPGFFDEKYFDCEHIKRLCLGQDDLWLKFTAWRNNIKVVKTDYCTLANYTCTINKSQVSALKHINTAGEQMNDIVFKNLLKFFNVDMSAWKYEKK